MGIIFFFCGNIRLHKNISIWIIHLDHNLKDSDKNVFLILNINRGPQVACSQMNSLNGKDRMCNISIIFWTCKEILWKLFFLFLFCEFILLIWNPLHWRESRLFIGEIREFNLESPRFSCLIQIIWFLDFGNLSPSLMKFVNKRIFIFNYLLTSIERLIFFRNLYTKEYFVFNSLLVVIGRFDFICKTKFCSLPNLTTYHTLNICHVSNMNDSSLVDPKFC